MFDISVVIPAYNAEKWIGRAIESVLNQTIVPAEILVVDDGSTDGTAQAIEEYGSRVRYIYQENAGCAAARNRGIEAATGQWIAFLDADDEWYPHKLELQVAILSRHKHLKWCACSYDIHTRSGSQQRTIGHRSRREFVRVGFLPNALRAARRDSPFHTPGMLIHRSVFARVGLFDESLSQTSDNDMWWQIAMHYPPIGYCPCPCDAVYMEIAGSVSKGDAVIPCSFRSLAKNLLIAKERPPEVRDEFFRLAKAVAFRKLVRLPFQRPDLLGPAFREYLGVVPLSRFAIIVLKIIGLLPHRLGRKVEGLVRDIHRMWDRWR